MRKAKLLLTSMFMIFLIIMLPVAFANELNLIYDANGNLVSGDGKYREYNSLNQLSKIYNGSDSSGLLLEELTYHPTQERILVKKVYNNDSTLKETVYYISEEFVRVVNSSGSYDFTYVKHNGQLVAQQNPDGSKIYIHGDHLGSSTVITNESGDVIENTTYSPFGEVVEGGTASRYGYEGKEHDSVVGDTDFHFRKYKASWALFLQPDTLIPNVYDPQSLNRYMFERGNPYKYTDESGHISNPVDQSLLFADVMVLLSYNDLIAINQDPNLATRLSNERARGLGILLVNPLMSLMGGTAANIFFSSYGIYGLEKAKRDVALANPLRYKAYLDKVTSNPIFSGENPYNIFADIQSYQKERLYSPGGVNLISSIAHVFSNMNINLASQTSIAQSMVNTARSGGGSVSWYYNPNTGNYQYWVGSGRPSNPDMEPVDDSSGGGSSGGGSSGSCRATGNAKCPD